MGGGLNGNPGVKQPTTTTTISHPMEFMLTSDPVQIAPARKAVEAFAQQVGMSEAAIADVGLCLNEALANVIRHAYANVPDKPIVIRAEYKDDAGESGGGELTVSIRDWGSGRNPAEQKPRPHDPLQPGGLGLICLRSLMDRVAYEPQPDGGMLLVMGKRKVVSC